MEKEIRLDFLQNPKINKEALVFSDFNFNSIAIKESQDEVFREKLRQRFNTNYALPFNFSSSGFIEFFLNFKEIYYTASLHYEIRTAINLLKNHIKSHVISLQDLDISKIDKNADSDTLIILPSINEDIFSINKIDEVYNATLALDISYLYRLNMPLPKSHIYFINGVTFGLLNGMGLILSHKIYTSGLYKKDFSKAFFNALDSTIQTDYTNITLYEKLKANLGDDVDLFAKDFAPNTLPLRLKHINTRNLIQNLYLDDIYIQSAQECYLGFIKPSFTLLSLGFGQVKARELCAITFDKIDDIDIVVSKITQSYKMIRIMEF